MRRLTLLTPQDQERLWLRLTDDEVEVEVRDQAGVRLASLLLGHDQQDLAAVLLESIAQHHQSAWSARAQFSLAELLSSWGRSEEAELAFNSVATALDRLFVPDVALNLAARSTSLGDRTAATCWYGKVLKLGDAPERSLAAYRLAQLHEESGERLQAMALLSACMREADEGLLPYAAFELAEMWHEHGNATMRCSLLERVLHSDHADLAPLAALQLGDAARLRGDYEFAQRYYDLCVGSEHPQHATHARERRLSLLKERLQSTVSSCVAVSHSGCSADSRRSEPDWERRPTVPAWRGTAEALDRDILLLCLSSAHRGVRLDYLAMLVDKVESWRRASRRLKLQALRRWQAPGEQITSFEQAVRRKAAPAAFTDAFNTLAFASHADDDHVCGLSALIQLWEPAVQTERVTVAGALVDSPVSWASLLDHNVLMYAHHGPANATPCSEHEPCRALRQSEFEWPRLTGPPPAYRPLRKWSTAPPCPIFAAPAVTIASRALVAGHLDDPAGAPALAGAPWAPKGD